MRDRSFLHKDAMPDARANFQLDRPGYLKKSLNEFAYGLGNPLVFGRWAREEYGGDPGEVIIRTIFGRRRREHRTF